MSKAQCSRCRGTGRISHDGAHISECGDCEGTGQLTYIDVTDERKVSGHNPSPPSDVERPPPTPAPPGVVRKENEAPNVALLKFDPSKIAAAADWMERNMGDMIRYHQSYARLQRERYVALLSVGFTPEQALELLKTPMF